jgi:hypothetical protein
LNELPHAYWIDKFKIRDYHFDEGLSQEWRQQWAKESVAYFYQKNLMIFSHQPSLIGGPSKRFEGDPSD